MDYGSEDLLRIFRAAIDVPDAGNWLVRGLLLNLSIEARRNAEDDHEQHCQRRYHRDNERDRYKRSSYANQNIHVELSLLCLLIDCHRLIV